MCTVITSPNLLGRTMDFPPRTPWKLTYLPADYQWQPAMGGRVLINHHRILGGMRYLPGHYLVGDGVNDAGLVCAELFFPVAATYQTTVTPGTLALTPQDFILWVLGHHDTVQEVIQDLPRISVINQAWFDGQHYPFHWLLMDQTGTYVIEPLAGHLRVWQNPAGVLTNTPALDQQLGRLNQMLGLTGHSFTPVTVNRLRTYGRPVRGGNSVDRFKKAALMRWQTGAGQPDQVTAFLQAVTVPHNKRHAHNYTHYRAVIDREKRQYSFTDLHNHRIIRQCLGNLTGPRIIRFDEN